jgi:parvulin-like peptidyl-prolyl isomerase
MVINTATISAIAAVGLAAIAVGPAAHAQAQRHTVTVKHAPIANPGDVSNSRSAQQNVAESEQYERLLRTNPAFRKARMQKECGGITDPELRQSCLASFDQH